MDGGAPAGVMKPDPGFDKDLLFSHSMAHDYEYSMI